MQALLAIAAALEPGGVLRLRDVAYSFPPTSADERIGAWIASAADWGWTGEQLAAHVRGEFSTYTWLLEEMFARAGFAVEERRTSDSGIFAYYTCRRA